MSGELSILLLSAASIGFIHTLLGPDHYLPFIAMSKSGDWSLRKTTLITFVCGIGHVLSSVLLGFVGIGFGVAVTKLVSVESFRGNIAAWILISVGIVYFIWGIRQAIRNKPHPHLHAHDNGISHGHEHSHNHDHMHIHDNKVKKDISPWILFTIFLFGPCEPLIPILMYPAAQNSLLGLTMVTLVFGLITVTTMLLIVLLSTYGISKLPTNKLERFSHAMAGGTILLCGIGIQFLGL